MDSRSVKKTVSLALLLILLCAGFIPSQPANTQSKKAAVIFLKHAGSQNATLPDFPQVLVDAIGTPRHTATIYTLMMNFKMSGYIREATYNHANVKFDAIRNPNSPDGWFTAPRPLEDYKAVEGQENLVFRDAIELVYAALGNAIENYDMLIVVQNFQSLYGYTLICGVTEPGDYVTCPISVGPKNLNISLVTVGEQEDDDGLYEVLAHELGHVFSLYHVRMGPYDIIGNSEVLTHYGGWSKVYAGWAEGITNMPYVNGPYSLTTILNPLSVPGNNVLRIPVFPTFGNNFVGYIVECRARIGYDANIPEEGVIITWVNTLPGYEYAAQIVFPLGGNDDSDAALAPGEAHADQVNGLTITYTEQMSGKRCAVEVNRGEIVAPDPSIKKGSETSSGTGYTNYSSRDIWLDSEKNGWDVYPAGASFTHEGGQSRPTGYGDPFWVNHENRIKFLIRNTGFSDAEQVFVDVYVTQPMILYLPCEDEYRPNDAVLIGTVKIDRLEKDGFFFGEVPWTPTTHAVARVDVVIRDYLGELSHANNTASETYAQQTILMMDAVRDIDHQALLTALEWPLSVTVQADPVCPINHRRYKFVRKVINAIDKKHWIMDIESMSGSLAPGQASEWALANLPPQDGQPGDCEEIVLELKALYDDIYVPVDGFTYQSCLVDASQLTCIAPLGTMLPGNTALINGKLGPADGGETIAMEYISPSGTRVLQYVTANPDGTYRDKFLAREVGTWKFQAFWQGTDQRASAQSGVCTLVVKEATPQPTFAPTRIQPPVLATPSPCGQYTTEPTCTRRTQCKWVVDVTGKGTCTAK